MRLISDERIVMSYCNAEKQCPEIRVAIRRLMVFAGILEVGFLSVLVLVIRFFFQILTFETDARVRLATVNLNLAKKIHKLETRIDRYHLPKVDLPKECIFHEDSMRLGRYKSEKGVLTKRDD
jgi:hypothetical protein